MTKPKPEEILRDAQRLKDDRFKVRFSDIREREDYRWRRVKPTIPDAYKDTATDYRSPLLEEQGKEIAALLYALPVPHQSPPTPEDQPKTTLVENFIMAAQQELEAQNGAVWWKNGMAQIHQKLGVISAGYKRGAYASGPKPPQPSTPLDAVRAFSAPVASPVI